MRSLCWKCRRTLALCFCSRIRVFEIEPRIVLLIHAKEARRSVGTARLVGLSIKDSVCFSGKGVDFDTRDELLTLTQNPSCLPVVLYPGPTSVNLSQSTPQFLADWAPPEKRLVILVIDGTWSLAKKMINSSKLLSSLPRVSFDVNAPSTYRFRRQPRSYCLSTVEAMVQLIENLHRGGLCTLPPNNTHRAMLDTFDWMVETQLAFNADASVT